MSEPVHFQVGRALCGVCEGFTEPPHPDKPAPLGGPHDCTCPRLQHRPLGTARKALALAVTLTAVVGGLEPIGYEPDEPEPPRENYSGWVCTHCRKPRFFKTESARGYHVRSHHPGQP